LGEWEQRDRRHSAREGVCDGWDGGDVGGTNQQKPARLIVAVYAFLDCQHEFRHPLNLVDYGAFEPLTTGRIRKCGATIA
jgi:hypothetical protein